MRVGIVGNGADKFTNLGASRAKILIHEFLTDKATCVVSGHSPLGGIDLWAEEVGMQLGLALDIKTPRTHSWSGAYGYRARNLDIARSSDLVIVILADTYPPEYRGRRFARCYHCAKVGRDPYNHIKSGGCWTAIQATLLGKPAQWCIIRNREGGG